MLDTRRLRVDLTDDGAFVHDDDSVRQGHDLVEILAEQQYGDVAFRRLAEIAVDGLDRADVEPAGRCRSDEHPEVAGELPRKHDLLKVATG